MEELTKVTFWRGQYKGVTFIAQQTKAFEQMGQDFAWTYYLLLSLEMFPVERQESLNIEPYYTDFGTPLHRYSDCPLSDLDWHGGMTWYSKEGEWGAPFRNIKVGCDFSHLWDEGQHYNLDSVVDEAHRCIDSLFIKFPDLKTSEQIWKDHRAKYPGPKKPNDDL